MRIATVTIKNFRAIKEITINTKSYTTIIGPNNCGKSSVLRAIELFLSQTNPHVEDWRNGHTEDPIEIEATFDNLETWEKEKPGVSGLVYNNAIRLRVLYAYNIEKSKIESTYEAFKPDEEIIGWASTWGEISEEIKTIIKTCSITIKKAAEWTKSKQETVLDHIRQHNPELILQSEPKWTNTSISIPPALKQALPQVILVPAVFDASDASSPATKSPYGQLLNRIIIPALQASKEFTDLTAAFEAISAKMSGSNEQLTEIQSIAEEISKRISSVVSATVKLTVAPPDMGKIFNSSAGIRINDGFETSVDHQGHGIQRALVFSLLETLAKINAKTEDNAKQRSTILLFEEPELFLHPHLMRRLKKALQEIGTNIEWQVITTTHSPFFVNVADDPLSLIICKKRAQNKELEVTQLHTDPFDGTENEKQVLRATLDFHPTVCEVFFAEKNTLVEGDSEIAILNHSELLNACGISNAEYDHCTIVSCAGKWTMLPIARLLKKFSIPFKIIHDEDRKNYTNEELNDLPAIAPYNANKHILEIVEDPNKIFIVKDTLEDLLWPLKRKKTSNRDKPFKAWSRAKKISEKNLIDQHVELKALVKFAFCW